MARSIIEIDLKDEKFQKFLKDFAKYDAAVKKQGNSWKAANKGLTDLADSGAKLTQGLREQEERLKKQGNLYDGIKRSTKQISADMKSVAGTTMSIIGNLVKWTGIGGILSGLIGLGGLWGVDRLAGSVSDVRRSAQGTGISIGQQSAYRLNFQRYVDADSNLNNIADAKSDYSKRWAFSAMGISPEGKDTASLGSEMLLRAKQMWDRSDKTKQFADNHGLLEFYSLDDLRRIGENSEGDIRASQGAYGRQAKSLNVNDRQAKQWQDLSVALETAKSKIWNVLVDGLSALAKPLTDLSGSVVKAIQTFLSSDSLKKFIPELGKGIENLAHYMTDKKFQDDLKKFGATIGTLVDNLVIISGKIVDVLRMLNLIPSVSDAAVSSAGNGSPLRNKNNELVKSMFSDFKRAGWSDEESAGIVANAIKESNLNPFAVGDNGKAYGLFQWHEDRRRAYTKMYGHTMESVKDPAQAWHEQSYFMNWETTQGPERKHLAKLRANAALFGAYGAGAEFSRGIERPANRDAEAKTRGLMAQQVLVTVNDNTGGNTSTNTQLANGVK